MYVFYNQYVYYLSTFFQDSESGHSCSTAILKLDKRLELKKLKTLLQSSEKLVTTYCTSLKNLQ